MTDSIRAAVFPAWGVSPQIGEVRAPEPSPGTTVVEFVAAAINPVDRAIGSGRFYLPLPDPPFVAGVEAVGHVVASNSHPVGALVWCLSPRGGCWAERFHVPDDAAVPVKAAVEEPSASVVMGVAGLAGWMAVLDRGELQEGETVVVLGATGAVGRTACEVARRRGARRVVAVARASENLFAMVRDGVDEVVAITEDGFADRLAAACPDGVDLVVDCLWGEPLVALSGRLARRGRIVQVGNACEPLCHLPAGPLRGGRIDIRGFSIFSEEPADVSRAHREMMDAYQAGDVRLPSIAYDFADAAEAWDHHGQSGIGASGVRLILTR